MQSMERRNERYRAMYIYKMIHGMVPDLGLVRKSSRDPTRAGSSLLPIQLKAGSSAIRTKLQNSILHQGVKRGRYDNVGELQGKRCEMELGMAMWG